MCFCCCDILCCDCLLVILAVFFPPLPVCIKRGCCSCDFFINICLCLLGWIPGMIHAWYIILKSPSTIINDEERQIFIVTPPQVTNVVVKTHPHQTRIQFAHPEPFLEDAQHQHTRFCNHRENSSLEGPLSPLSEPGPLLAGNYGTATDNQNDDLFNNSVPPPSYDNVMNETAKEFR